MAKAKYGYKHRVHKMLDFMFYFATFDSSSQAQALALPSSFHQEILPEVSKNWNWKAGLGKNNCKPGTYTFSDHVFDLPWTI